MGRETYLRSGKSIDQRVTARALDRVADWLDMSSRNSARSSLITPGTVLAQLRDLLDDEAPEASEEQKTCHVANLCAKLRLWHTPTSIPSNHIRSITRGISCIRLS